MPTFHFSPCQAKKVVFTVTCLEKHGSVGQDFFVLIYFFSNPNN